MEHLFRMKIAFFYKLWRDTYKIFKEICFLIKECETLHPEVEHAF